MNALMRWCVPDGVFWTREDERRVLVEVIEAAIVLIDQHVKRARFAEWRAEQAAARLRR